MAKERLPIVFFSHERWDARGRAHELATRFAKERPVILVEQPTRAEPGVPDSWDLEFPMRQLLVGRPVLTRSSAAAARRCVPAMVRQLLRWQDVAGEWIAWLDAPAAFPLARHLAPHLMVYDCAGRGPSLEGDTTREAELVGEADLLFLGEPHADPSSWDGLAAHMLRELEKAERGRARPLRALGDDLCAPLA